MITILTLQRFVEKLEIALIARHQILERIIGAFSLNARRAKRQSLMEIIVASWSHLIFSISSFKTYSQDPFIFDIESQI